MHDNYATARDPRREMPGLIKICKKLRRAHPMWSDDTIMAHAKIEWHKRNPSK